jgi:hypothetical protein
MTQFSPATAEQQAKARRQVQEQQGDLPSTQVMGGQDPSALGRRVHDAGAQVTGVDAGELLSYIRDLEKRVQNVEAERQAERTAGKPGVVLVAQNLVDQLRHRHEALGGSPVLKDALDLAVKVADAAATAVDTGSGAELLSLTGALAAKLTRVATAAASADISYPLQIASEDLPEAAAGIRRSSGMLQGQVVSSSTEAPRRGLAAGKVYEPVS